MDKRTFLKLSGALSLGAVLDPVWQLWARGANPLEQAEPTAFFLPELGFAYDALEPFIDAKTMEIHHGKHHAAYVNNLNKAIKGTPQDSMSLLELLSKVTANQVAIMNNGGGHFNHTLFWSVLGSWGGALPSDKLAIAIQRDFGNLETFKKQFSEAALGIFGSGWAWLCSSQEGKLFITTTRNQENPLMSTIIKDPGIPILGLDVWEHAYYLKYQNRRAEYVTAFMNVIRWDAVSEHYAKAIA